MRLPLPNADDVREFRDLYERRFSVTLSSAEAQELATAVVQLHFVKDHAILHLRQEEFGE